jgi:exonuclease III
MDDKIHISEYAPTRVSVHLLGTTRAGDPATQLLWNVNGFSSQWRSSQVVLEKDMASVVAGNASQTKKKRQLKRKIAKADFKTMVVTSGSPDFLTIVESKLSLAKMMALPGFISWCEHMGYHHIALSWSTNESKGGAGYAGIMTLSKIRPISTTFDFEGVPTDEARCVTHEFESFIHVSVYSPCTGYDAIKMAARIKFDLDLRKHLTAQQAHHRKPVICSGDLNVNPRRQDWHEKAFVSLPHLKEASGCQHDPGYSPQELTGYDQLLRATGMSNAWESLYPYSEQGMTWPHPLIPLG